MRRQGFWDSEPTRSRKEKAEKLYNESEKKKQQHLYYDIQPLRENVVNGLVFASIILPKTEKNSWTG